MLSLTDKIKILESCLSQNDNSYADSFKTDIVIFFGDFVVQNPTLNFLEKLSSKKEIVCWVTNLTSRIVLKFDEENEQLSDFIFDYIG